MKNTSIKKRRRISIPYIALTLVSIYTVIPLYYVLVNAFKKPEFIQLQPFYITMKQVTFANIIRTFKLMKYPEALAANVIILAISCSILIVVGSMAGYAITIAKSKLLDGYYTFCILIIAIPFQIVMVPMVIIMKKINLINNYLGISMVYAALSLPIVIFLYTGFMKSLPKELNEAAIVDGCGILKSYIYIYMPLLKAVTGTVIIIRGTSIWNDFLVPLVTISKSAMTPLTLRLYSFASMRFNSWDLIFGGTLLCSIPVIIIFLALQKYFIKGMTAGAVKG